MQTTIVTQPLSSKQENNPSRIHAFLRDLAVICQTHCCSIYLKNEEGQRPTTVVRFTDSILYKELEAWGNPYKAKASVYCPELDLHIRTR